MVFTTLLCKFYSQLQLNGVCFVHCWHRHQTHTQNTSHTHNTAQSIERTQHSWRRENKFSCRKMLCAIRVNSEKREETTEKPNGNGKNDNNTSDDGISLAATEKHSRIEWFVSFFLCSALLRVNVLTVSGMRRLLFTHFYFFVTQMGSKFIRTNFNASIKSTVSMDRHRHRIRCHLMHSAHTQWMAANLLHLTFTANALAISANKKLRRNRGPC